MEIRWLNAVLDQPEPTFAEVGAFWLKLAAVRMGEVHPDHEEFVHLLPASGDMHLELQRIDSGPASAHLDLLVDDIPAWTERAVSLGARLVAQPGHAVLETPGGVPFCIVPAGSESQRAPAIDPGRPHAADQICLDVPHDRFEADVEFWHSLTGWEPNPQLSPEFRSFAEPDHLPLRILIQRLGVDDTGRGRAHLDISCGEHVAELTAEHVEAGASLVKAHQRWTALADPGGMPYCLTSRQPNL